MKEKILIINEDKYFVKVLSQFLVSMNFEVSTLFDSSECVNEIKSVMPELLILDYDMDKLDGLSITKLLKNISELKHIPIFMFIPDLEKNEIEKITHAGVDDFLIKPFDPNLFASKIKNFLQKESPSKTETTTDKSKKKTVKKTKILIIEDVSEATSGLQIILRKNVYSVTMTDNIREGLDYLRQNPVDLLFLDRTLNNNMGVKICHAIKKHKLLKNIPVIMMTQELDMTIEFQAIAAGASFVFKKPIIEDKQMIMVKIVETLEEFAQKVVTIEENKTETLKKKQQETQLNIKNLLKRVRNLTTTPFIVSRINTLVDNPSTGLSKLTKIIKSDQALTSRILKLVNSPYFALRQKIPTIQKAVNYIGFEATKKISQAIAAYEFLSKEGKQGIFDREAYWEHCLSVATHSKQIARVIAHEQPEDAFIAGLLHDVGKSVLSEYAGESFVEAFIHAANEKIPLHVAEKTIIGSSHAACGKEFLSKWCMPEAIIESSCYHHQSLSEIQANQNITAKQIVLSVKMANTICKAKLLGYSGNSFIDEPLEKLAEILYINQHKFERILTEGKNEFENYKSHVFLNKKKSKTNKLLSYDLYNSRNSKNILIISSNSKFNLFSLILGNAGYKVSMHSFETDFETIFKKKEEFSSIVINFDTKKKDQLLSAVNIFNQFYNIHHHKPLIIIGDEAISKMFKRVTKDPFVLFTFPLDPEEFLTSIDQLNGTVDI